MVAGKTINKIIFHHTAVSSSKSNGGLYNLGEHTTTEEEIEYAQAYLEIEKVLFSFQFILLIC